MVHVCSTVEPHWCLYDASSVLPHLTHVLQRVHSSLLLILGEEISTAQVAIYMRYVECNRH